MKKQETDSRVPSRSWLDRGRAVLQSLIRISNKPSPARQVDRDRSGVVHVPLSEARGYSLGRRFR